MAAFLGAKATIAAPVSDSDFEWNRSVKRSATAQAKRLVAAGKTIEQVRAFNAESK